MPIHLRRYVCSIDIGIERRLLWSYTRIIFLVVPRSL